MANYLIINAGSTSVKYKVYDEAEAELARGTLVGPDFRSNIKQLLRQVINLGEIRAVGHRVVHGGWRFHEPTLVTPAVLDELGEISYLAPLHNPHNLAGIEAAADFLPEVPQAAVFDTAFFADLPDPAKTYGLPLGLIQEFHLRRYGFHGLSHEFALAQAAEELGKKTSKLNLISCHLGGGASVAAIKQGKPVDISNGYTPTEGLLMLTRTGDIDPGLVLELLRLLPGEINEEKVEALAHMLNCESGIKGLSGGTGDFLELIREVSLGQPKAVAAFETFIYRLTKYIGAYWSVLEGKVDAIALTGAVGAGHPLTRDWLKRRLKFLGGVPLLVVPPNEELIILRKLRTLLKPL